MIIKDSFIRDMAKLVAWYPLRWFVSAAPWSVAYTLGTAVGALDSRISSGRVHKITDNLKTAFGDSMDEARARRIAATIVRSHYVEHMEFYKFASLNPKNLHEHIVFEGIEHVHRAIDAGRGAILVHMHFGSKQFPLVALGLSGYPVAQVGYRDPHAEDYSFIHKNVHLRIRMRLEQKFRAKHVHVGNSMRPLYKILENNELLMITGDGIGGVRGAGANYLPVPFLGKTLMLPPGPARLARHTGAALIPLFCVREPDQWRYRAVFEAPIEQQRSDDRNADILTNTRRFAEVFERYVAKYPDHWLFWEEFTEGNLLAKQTE